MRVLLMLITFSLFLHGSGQTALNENKLVQRFIENFNYAGSNPCSYLGRPSSTVPFIWWGQRWHQYSLSGQDNVCFKSDCSFLDIVTQELLIRVEKGPFTQTWNYDEFGNPIVPPNVVTYDYGGNWITTHGAFDEEKDMDYGIYELRFKLRPATLNGVHQNEGLSFKAGLYGVDPGVICHAEIDFFEMSGWENRFTHNFLWGGGNPGDCNTSSNGSTLPAHEGLNKINFYDIDYKIGCSAERYAGFYIHNDPLYPDDQNGYTTITIEVTPQKLTWYRNGKTIQSTTGDEYHTNSLQNLPTMEFGFAVSVGDDHNPHITQNSGRIFPDSNTVFPFQVDIDYFRFYKFRCQDTTIKDESGGARFTNANISFYLYKEIHIADDGQGGARIKAGERITLRAKDEIELLPGFEVEIGGDLYADVHSCDN